LGTSYPRHELFEINKRILGSGGDPVLRPLWSMSKASKKGVVKSVVLRAEVGSVVWVKVWKCCIRKAYQAFVSFE
jgi:hypothetical protein